MDQITDQAKEPQHEPLPGPFISYSRADLVFAQKLYNTLRMRNRDAWVDLEGIEPSEAWLDKLYAAIESTQAFVFIISEESVTSRYCQDEIRHAIDNNKKLIPILYREVDNSQLPSELAARQWISFLDPARFETSVNELVEALDTDLDWLNEHTRQLMRAKEWDRQERNKSYLLRGSDLEDVEQWLLDSAKVTNRQPTALQAEFIRASRQSQRTSRNRLLTGVSMAALIMSVLAIAAVQQRNQAQRNERQAVSRLLAAQSVGGLEQNLNLSIRLAIAAYQRAPTFEARQALLSAVYTRPHLAKYFYGHNQRLHQLRFDSSQKWLVSSSYDGTIIVWDVNTGQQHLRVENRDVPQPAIAISAEANLLAAADMDRIRLWTPALSAFEEIDSLPQTTLVVALTFSPDGRLLAWGGTDGRVGIWKMRDREQLCVSTARHAAPQVGLRFHTKKQQVASVDAAGNVISWDVATCHPNTTYEIGGGGPSAAIRSDLSKIAITDMGPPTFLFFDLATRNAERVDVQTDMLMSLDYHPHGERIALGVRDATIGLWAPDQNKISKTLRGHTSDVTSVTFDHKGERLASGSIFGEVILWDLTESSPMESIRSFPEPDVAAVFFLPNGHLFAANGYAAAKILETDTGHIVSTIPPLSFRVDQLVLSPNGQYLAGRANGKLIIREVTNGGLIEELPILSSTQSDLVFSPDNRFLAFADGKTIFLWDLEQRSKISVDKIQSQQAPVIPLTFTPDARKLVFVGSKELLTLVDLQTRQTIRLDIKQHKSYIRTVALSNDGTILATGGGMYDGDIALWEVSTGRYLRTLHIDHDTDVSNLHFAPDDQLLISVTYASNRLRLWDVATGRLLREPIPVACPAAGNWLTESCPIAFNQDGTLLAATEKNTIVLRSFDPTHWIKAACQSVQHGLTTDEWQDYVGEAAFEKACSD